MIYQSYAVKIAGGKAEVISAGDREETIEAAYQAAQKIEKPGTAAVVCLDIDSGLIFRDEGQLVDDARRVKADKARLAKLDGEKAEKRAAEEAERARANAETAVETLAAIEERTAGEVAAARERAEAARKAADEAAKRVKPAKPARKAAPK